MQAARLESLEQFRKGEASFLLATDVAARGLDILGVQTVINYDCPTTLEPYLHRIGRTARAGEAGLAITFVEDSDRGLLKMVVKKVKATLTNRVVPAATVAGWRERVERLYPQVQEIIEVCGPFTHACVARLFARLVCMCSGISYQLGESWGGCASACLPLVLSSLRNWHHALRLWPKARPFLKMIVRCLSRVQRPAMCAHRALPIVLYFNVDGAVGTCGLSSWPLQEEKQEKELRKAEMLGDKAVNMIEHRSEIMSRPKKEWFQSGKEKQDVSDASRERMTQDAEATRRGKNARAVRNAEQKGAPLCSQLLESPCIMERCTVGYSSVLSVFVNVSISN